MLLLFASDMSPKNDEFSTFKNVGDNIGTGGSIPQPSYNCDTCSQRIHFTNN